MLFWLKLAYHLQEGLVGGFAMITLISQHNILMRNLFNRFS